MGLTKVCSKCGIEFGLDNFSKHKGCKDGLRGTCSGCASEYNSAWHKANTERVKAKSKKWYKVNPEKAKASSKAWKKANPEKVKATIKKRYNSNSERLNASSKAWYEVNQEKAKAANKAWYLANPEKAKASSKARREANPEQTKAAGEKWRGANPERARADTRAWQKANPEKTRQYKHRRNATKRSLLSTLTVTQWGDIKLHFNNTCCYCGEEKPLHQEHFLALSNKGEYSHNNILPSCSSCNSSKGAKPFSLWYPRFKHYSKKREKIIFNFLNYKNGIQQLALT